MPWTLPAAWTDDQDRCDAAGVPETALAYYEVLKAGGFSTGGTNFDSKVRRQSLDAEDLILAHVGGMDVCAAGLKAAARMLEDGKLEAARTERYAGWDSAQDLLGSDLATLAARVESEGIEPEPRSGRQERLENLLNRYL